MTVTINSIASDVVGHYSRAARNLVAAYRSGSVRALAASGDRYAQLVDKVQLPLVNDERKAKIVAAERRVAEFVAGGVDRIATGYEKAIDLASERSLKGIESFAEQTAWTKDMFVVNAVRQVQLPAAKLQLEIASRIEGAVQQLNERVAGEPVAPVAAKPATKRVAKRRAGRA